MELFSAITDVATPASLIAFMIAAVALVATTYLKTRSKRDVDAVKSAPENDRRALIENLWEREGLDRFNPGNLTREQRYDLVLKTLEQRDTKLRAILLATVAIVIIVAILLAVLILTDRNPVQESVQLPTPTPNTPPIIRDVITSYEEGALEPVEYTIQENTTWSQDAAQEIIRLSSLYSVELEDGQLAFDIHFNIKNPTSQSISLTLSPSFFSLEDNQGQIAQQLFFCCSAQGAILTPNQERDVRVVFEDRWSGGKYEYPARAPDVSIIVRGIAPVTRATWYAPLLLALE